MAKKSQDTPKEEKFGGDFFLEMGFVLRYQDLFLKLQYSRLYGTTTRLDTD